MNGAIQSTRVELTTGDRQADGTPLIASTRTSLRLPRALFSRAASRWLALLLLLCAAGPLLWPSLPPLVDLPNHLSRYHIALNYAASPAFRHWFLIRHVLVGNLGVDLLAAALGPVLGLEPAVKLIVLAIPVLATAGLLLIAVEVHGRIGFSTALAAILVYNFPFNFGFLNYTLAMSLALLAFGLWLRLERLGRTRLRAALFVPIGFAVWLAHASGWGALGLMVFGWEMASARRTRTGWLPALVRAGLRCLPLAVPLVPMLLWSAHVPAGNYPPPETPLHRKFIVFFMMLRDGVQIIDALSIFLLVVIATLPLVRPDLGMERRLATAGGMLLAAYIAIPPNVIGSAHADMRLAPYAMMLLLLALETRATTKLTRWLTRLAPAFLIGHTIYHTINYAQLATRQQHQLEALKHIPRGTTVFAFAHTSCDGDMSGHRMEHLHRMALVRRDAFVNGSWGFPATQTVLARRAMTTGYMDDGSQLWEPLRCLERADHLIGPALASIPRERFRYLWLLDAAPESWPRRPWLHLVWHHDSGALYSIDPPAARGRAF